MRFKNNKNRDKVKGKTDEPSFRKPGVPGMARKSRQDNQKTIPPGPMAEPVAAKSKKGTTGKQDYATGELLNKAKNKPVFAGEQQETKKIKPSLGRRILLFVLPMVAVSLMVVLVLLIINMPKGKPIQMEINTLPVATRLLTPEVVETEAIIESSAGESEEPEEEREKVVRMVNKVYLESLIQTGAGIPPGEQSEPKIVDNPERLIWRSPSAAAEQNIVTPSEWREVAQASQAETGESETAQISNLPTLPLETRGEIGAAESANETAEFLPEQTETPSDSLSLETTPTIVPTVAPTTAPTTAPTSNNAAIAEGFYPTQVQAYVYGDVVNVRMNAALDAEILREVHAGEVVYEIETNGSWSRVRLSDGFEGYIYTNLLSYNYVPTAEVVEEQIVVQPTYQDSEFEPYYGILYSEFSGVNIRKTPSTAGEIIGTMLYGDWCEAIGYTGGWFQIQWYDGEVAYVHGDFLTTEQIAPEELTGQVVHEEVQYIAAEIPQNTANLAGGSAVANTALQYVGYPYVYATAGPNSFDCSGFAQYIYSLQGVYIGRSTYDQVYEGISVPFGYKDYSSLIPGDLVFFGAGTNVYHVGIYIGGGQMVHAGTEATGVVVDSLNLDFWAARIAQVRRILY